MVVEYDDWRDEQVWMYDLAGRYVCQAALRCKRPGIPASRVAENLAKTAEGQRKRLELKLAEQAGRSRLPVSASQLVEALDSAPAAEPDTDAEQVLGSGISFDPPAPQISLRPRAVTSQARALAAELDHTDEIETAAERFARARALQAATEIGDEDARWLVIYRSSAEYCAHQLLEEDADGDTSTSVL
jgi:hypothetical protein